MTGTETIIGIDVSQGLFGPVGTSGRPGLAMRLRRSGVVRGGVGAVSVGAGWDHSGGYWGFGGSTGGGVECCRPAGGGGEPPAGAGVWSSQRAAGQDRPDGRPAAGGLWSHDAAGGKAVARRVLAGVAGAGDAPAAAHRDADPGAQPETTSAGASGPADPGAPGPVG